MINSDTMKLGALLVAGVMAFAGVKYATGRNSERHDDLEVRVGLLEHQARLNEVAMAELVRDLTHIKESTDEIRTILMKEYSR